MSSTSLLMTSKRLRDWPPERKKERRRLELSEERKQALNLGHVKLQNVLQKKSNEVATV
jgi:hypothetical protein